MENYSTAFQPLPFMFGFLFISRVEKLEKVPKKRQNDSGQTMLSATRKLKPIHARIDQKKV